MAVIPSFIVTEVMELQELCQGMLPAPPNSPVPVITSL